MNVRQLVSGAQALVRTGILWPPWPPDYLRMAEVALRRGPTLAAASEIAALRAPHQAAVVDDHGAISWRDADGSANAIARALEEAGIGADDTVGLVWRNDRNFVLVALAVTKLGADLVLLNTEFAAGQLGDVLEREGITAVAYDDELGHLVEEAAFDGPTFGTTWVEKILATGSRAALRPSGPLGRPARAGRIVIMTSGTTGLPKGAQRDTFTPGVETVVSAFAQLPLRAHEPVVVAPPLFHLLGFGFMGFALGLQGTLVVRRRFDPEALLAAVAEHRATTLVAVPVMLQRIVALPESTRRRYDTSSLRVIVCSGSSLSPALAAEVMDAFGDVLYNFYGSTETGWATVATPADLRAAPGTAGRPPSGIRVSILDEDGTPVGSGRRGRIFVGSAMAFQGYTGGGGKEIVGGLMSTGDTGYLDDQGRLFVEGRDDEMIVSGGENVFPVEVEELLRSHEAVADAAVVGVEDEDMGQRLAAFVVRRPGATLSADDVKDHVRSRLARFKVPRTVRFVDEIPRNAVGKVLRGELPDTPPTRSTS